MPVIFLEAENVIDRIHRSAVISYRNIIKKMDAYKTQCPGTSDIEAAYLVAAEIEIEIDFEAEIQLGKVSRVPNKIGSE